MKVGQAVIQIAARKGIKTINFVRNRYVLVNELWMAIIEDCRPDLDNLIASLTQLGATHVFTYDALTEKALVNQVRQWTSKAVSMSVYLFSNCNESNSPLRLTANTPYVELRGRARYNSYDTIPRRKCPSRLIWSYV